MYKRLYIINITFQPSSIVSAQRGEEMKVLMIKWAEMFDVFEIY